MKEQCYGLAAGAITSASTTAATGGRSHGSVSAQGQTSPGSTGDAVAIADVAIHQVGVQQDQISLNALNSHILEAAGGGHDVERARRSLGGLVGSLSLAGEQMAGVLQMAEADVLRRSGIAIDVQNQLTLSISSVADLVSRVGLVQVGSHAADIGAHIGSEAVAVVHIDAADGGTLDRLPVDELGDQLGGHGVAHDDVGDTLDLGQLGQLMHDRLQLELDGLCHVGEGIASEARGSLQIHGVGQGHGLQLVGVGLHAVVLLELVVEELDGRHALLHLLSADDLIHHAVVVVQIQQGGSILDLLHGEGHVPTRAVGNGEPQNFTPLTDRDGTQVLLIGQMAIQHNAGHLAAGGGTGNTVGLEVDPAGDQIMNLGAVGRSEVQVAVDQSAAGAELDCDAVAHQLNSLLTTDFHGTDLQIEGELIQGRVGANYIIGDDVVIVQAAVGQLDDVLLDGQALGGIPHLLPGAIEHALGVLQLLAGLVVHQVGGADVLGDVGGLDSLHLDDVLQDGAEELLHQHGELQGGDGEEAGDGRRLRVGPDLVVPELVAVLDDGSDVGIAGARLLEALQNRLHQVLFVALHEGAVRHHGLHVGLDVDAVALQVLGGQIVEVFLEGLAALGLVAAECGAGNCGGMAVLVSSRFKEPTNVTRAHGYQNSFTINFLLKGICGLAVDFT